MTIKVTYAGKKVTVKVPKGIDDIEIEVPPVDTSGENKKPLVILTDRM